MPFGDGTGPAGTGPMTGRGAGYCAGYATPGSMNPIPGRGFWGGGGGLGGGGGGRGGRGRRNRFYATGMPGWMRASYGYPVGAPVAPMAPPMGAWGQPGPEQQLDTLKGQAEYLEDMLDGVKQRISELETAKVSKDG